MNRYKVLGISSGLGVSVHPFKDQLIATVEGRSLFHTPGNEQWKSNFPNIPLYRELPKEDNFFGPVDVMISSPDCGSGSVFRFSRAKKLGNHKKNVSLLLFFQAMVKYKPKFFLFENLDGLFKSFKKDDFINICHEYNLIIHNAPVSAWGNSQLTRKRLVIIGIRKDLPFKKLKKYFKLPNYKNQIKTCFELYGELKDENIPLGHTREQISSIISIHGGKRMKLKEIQLEWKNRLRGKKRWLTEEGFNFKTAPGVYRNLKNDYPATARKANRQYDHNGLTLSPRQLARIQGVPDEFNLYLNPDKLNYWINKARTTVTKTPPYEISVWFKSKLEKSIRLWLSKK